MVHLAIHEALDGKHIDWMEHVTDEEYLVPRSDHDPKLIEFAVNSSYLFESNVFRGKCFDHEYRNKTGVWQCRCRTRRGNSGCDQNDVDSFLAQVKATPVPTKYRQWQTGLCHGCDHEPSASRGMQPCKPRLKCFVKQAGLADLTSSWSIFAALASAGHRSGYRMPNALARLMTTVDCRGGNTQIDKVLEARPQGSQNRQG